MGWALLVKPCWCSINLRTKLEWQMVKEVFYYKTYHINFVVFLSATDYFWTAHSSFIMSFSTPPCEGSVMLKVLTVDLFPCISDLHTPNTHTRCWCRCVRPLVITDSSVDVCYQKSQSLSSESIFLLLQHHPPPHHCIHLSATKQPNCSFKTSLWSIKNRLVSALMA